MREIIVRTLKEVEVPVEELHELRKNAFKQWEEAGLDAMISLLKHCRV